MRERRESVLFGVTVAFLLVCAGPAFSQMSGGQGMGGKPGGMSPMVWGEVSGIDEKSITVITESGSTERLTLSTATSFVRETAADSSALAIGETVVVIGQSGGQNSIVPRMVRIVDKIDDRPRSGGQGGQMMQGGQAGGGQMMQGGGQARGGQFQNQTPGGGGQMMGGLVVGAVIGLDPLKIEQPSGGTTVAKLTDSTRIVIEKSTSSSQVVKGARVRVLAPPTSGSAAREARKVIILSDTMTPGPPR